MDLLAFIFSLLGSAALTRVVRNSAIRHNWVSGPSSPRHLHTRPVPRLGGVAIFLTVWLAVLFARWMPGHLRTALGPHTFGIMGPATLVFALGLLDDIYGLSAWCKFTVQAGAAFLLYVNGFGISEISFQVGGSSVGWLIGLPLTILWVLGITNAFNLLDGLDGLAAGSALFSTVVICIIALLGQNQTIVILGLCLAGAIAGFLRYNFNPASIFLGDCGSLFIGFMLSAIALAGSQKSPTMVAVAIPIVSLGLPILDVTISVIRRFLSGQRLFVADCEHIHHRLMSRGIPHRQVVLLLYGVTACFGLLSLFLLNPGSRTAGTVLVVIGFGVMIGVQQLRYHEFFELRQAASRVLNARQLIANDVRIHRTAEMLRSCATIDELCVLLQTCLMPIGFDGFGLYLTSDLPDDLACFPLRQVNKSKLNFFWDESFTDSEPMWSLTFSMLEKDNRRRLGDFILYRNSTLAPVCVDMNLFTDTRFSRELAGVIERIQPHWLNARREPDTSSYRQPAAQTGT